MCTLDRLIRLSARAGIVLGAFLLVTVLLAAMPGHRAPAAESPDAQQSPAPQPHKPPITDPHMPGMDMEDAQANEAHAVHDMAADQHNAHNPHLYMTSKRPRTPEDGQRANEIVAELRSGIQRYKDYHLALNDGYKVFLPNLPQLE